MKPVTAQALFQCT
jgi:hypothetical protein